MSRQQRTRPIDDLPLFADDLDIGAAILGPKRAGEWKAIAPLLEPRGLPKIDKLHGGRYVPAVRSFYDRDNLIAPLVPASPDGVEHPESWSKERRRRA
jgi:hypothetical protein